MGLSHGGLRQKNFNFYEETLKVPLVYSNPTMFPRPVISDALVSHVDLLPTLASLAGAPPSAPKPPQWEMYDLKTDPYEEVNLAFESYERTPTQEREFLRLRPLANPA